MMFLDTETILKDADIQKLHLTNYLDNNATLRNNLFTAYAKHMK